MDIEVQGRVAGAQTVNQIYLDTARLIEFGQAAEGKGTLETQMILNHKQAIEYLVHDPDHARLTPSTIIASDACAPSPSVAHHEQSPSPVSRSS